VTLAAHHAVPAIYGLREFAASGSLMSYERLELQALDRGLGSEGPAGFRSRRRNGHDRMPVASHFAASYKASRVLIAARRRGSLARSASPGGPFACDRSVAAQPASRATRFRRAITWRQGSLNGSISHQLRPSARDAVTNDTAGSAGCH
jgi:hypothetical protein